MKAAQRKVESERGKLVFGFDATASRSAMWAQAMALQKEMFKAARALEVQLAVYLGNDLRISQWESEPEKLEALMEQISCVGGQTQIERLLAHIVEENAKGGKRGVSAFVFVGDTFEEASRLANVKALAKALGDLRVRGFFFLDKTSEPWHLEENEQIYRELAKLTGGAYADFEPGAVAKLRDLLQSVAAYASGGMRALASRDSEASRLLLTQMK
jgi:hypothetical protein